MQLDSPGSSTVLWHRGGVRIVRTSTGNVQVVGDPDPVIYAFNTFRGVICAPFILLLPWGLFMASGGQTKPGLGSWDIITMLILYVSIWVCCIAVTWLTVPRGWARMWTRRFDIDVMARIVRFTGAPFLRFEFSLDQIKEVLVVVALLQDGSARVYLCLATSRRKSHILITESWASMSAENRQVTILQEAGRVLADALHVGFRSDQVGWQTEMSVQDWR
jgi:hypothetical protein